MMIKKNALMAGIVGTMLLAAATVAAQTASVPFGGVSHDTKQPVEIVSDSFSLDQSGGTAEFVGNVVVGQGDMRLSARKIVVEYAATEGDATGRIDRMVATGGVTLVSGSEAAESQSAIYSIDDGKIVMTGNVILTQGANALSGQKITINLKTGAAAIEGRVKTIFQTGGSQ